MMTQDTELMKAVLVTEPGGAENLKLDAWQKPVPERNQVLVKVKATALNRADILQRQGKYPPPKGASPILGLEIAGEVVACGKEVKRWKTGDKVFGLLPGGGYAEYAVIHEEMAMPLPEHMDYTEAAAIPEVFLTAFQALSWLGRLEKGERILIHAGASGVGTAAIQLAIEMGAEVLVTASSSKHELCLKMGASHAIDYKAGPFQPEVMKYTRGSGVDVIIDFIAGPYFSQNLECLRTDGRLILLAGLGGSKAEDIDLRHILMKRLSVIGSTLRSRSLDYQIKLTKDLFAFTEERFRDKRLEPVIDKVFDWSDVVAAHRYMESNQNAGKIVLAVSLSHCK
jgi:tumor protein p53-inducible protein 3